MKKNVKQEEAQVHRDLLFSLEMLRVADDMTICPRLLDVVQSNTQKERVHLVMPRHGIALREVPDFADIWNRNEFIECATIFLAACSGIQVWHDDLEGGALLRNVLFDASLPSCRYVFIDFGKMVPWKESTRSINSIVWEWTNRIEDALLKVSRRRTWFRPIVE